MHETEPDAALWGMLRTLRSTLHACPEPAGAEALTSNIIASFVGAYTPKHLITGLGGHGVAAIFEGAQPGPTVVVRAELDALPVEEKRAEPWTPEAPRFFENTAHRCGHDGHMAIVAGLAPFIRQTPLEKGRVVLLFQPAEETGEGALRVLEDSKFPELQPDMMIALHNVPGFARHSIVSRKGTLASASLGMRITLQGASAHAAEPEKARSPSTVLQRLLEKLPLLSDAKAKPYRLLTITHARLGRESFGITPGRAQLCATLRSASEESLLQLDQQADNLIHETAGKEGISVEIERVDQFPHTENDPKLVDLLRECCAESQLNFKELPRPFRWSEDFGHFSRTCPSLFFGLGIGEDAARLHQPDYCFPDDVLATGVRLFDRLIRRIDQF